MDKKKVYFRVPNEITIDEFCPECDNQLYYAERSGHKYCMKCDYENWED